VFFFEGDSADEVWISAANEANNLSSANLQDSRAGKTKELFRSQFLIKDPLQRWVVNRMPPLNPAFALAEVIWIINGKNESSYLNYWNKRLPEFAGSGDTYHGAYGYRLRMAQGIDQLDRAFLALKRNPDSRQVILQIWDAESDLPRENGKPADPDIPCNVFAMLKIREGKLEWSQFMRSNDLFLGTPHNFVQFTTLQEVLAGWLNVEVGTYFHYSDSLHTYINEDSSILAYTSDRVKANHDRLALSKPNSEKLFSQLYNQTKKLINPHLSLAQWRKIADLKFPEAYKNIFMILVAEAARRRKWVDEIGNALEHCTNPVFEQLWDRWYSRVNNDKQLRIESKEERVSSNLPS
jgi:thymidylate synthase